jgi:hypothetical protein
MTMTTKVSLKTGDWFVYESSWKRWGNVMIKVVKRTPKMITIAVSEYEVRDNENMEDYDEDKIKESFTEFRLKVRTFESGSEYIEVPKTDCYMGYFLIFNNVFRFDSIQDMGRFMVRTHSKYQNINDFDRKLKSEYDIVLNEERIAKEKKAVREETVKCLVKKTIIPVEIKQMIMGWL